MATRVNGFKKIARLVSEDLNQRYQSDHPDSRIDAYAVPYGVRVRVVDPAFAGRGLRERQEIVWTHLKELPKDVQDGITTTLFITPEEREMSLLSLEFDDPSRSLL